MTSPIASDKLTPDDEAQPTHDFEVVLAKMIALAARNGVEDLHAAGAFSDQQAPALNRRIRGRVYELLVATHRCDYRRDDDPVAAMWETGNVAGHENGRAQLLGS